MNVTVMAMEEKDISSLSVIEQDCPGAWREDHFRSAFSETGVWARVAVNGCVRGFGIARKAFQELQIDRIAVSAECRKQGIGTMLMEALLAFGRQANCREVFLEVRASNNAALCLYKGLGFEVLLRRKAYYDNGEDALVMRKDMLC